MARKRKAAGGNRGITTPGSEKATRNQGAKTPTRTAAPTMRTWQQESEQSRADGLRLDQAGSRREAAQALPGATKKERNVVFFRDAPGSRYRLRWRLLR